MKSNATDADNALGGKNQKDGFGAFEVYKAMFDQSLWHDADVTRDVSAACAKDVKLFLKDLQQEVPWALHGKNIRTNT